MKRLGLAVVAVIVAGLMGVGGYWAYLASDRPDAIAEADARRGAPVRKAAPEIDAPPPEPPPVFPAEPTGKPDQVMAFRHVPPVIATMELKRYGDIWRVKLEGGGDPTLGGNMPPVCEQHAHGHKENGSIFARLVPFEGEFSTASAEELAAQPGGVVVTLGNRTAEVAFGGTTYCPLFSRLGGSYRRI